jgi:hypothetical protein
MSSRERRPTLCQLPIALLDSKRPQHLTKATLWRFAVDMETKEKTANR